MLMGWYGLSFFISVFLKSVLVHFVLHFLSLKSAAIQNCVCMSRRTAAHAMFTILADFKVGVLLLDWSSLLVLFRVRICCRLRRIFCFNSRISRSLSSSSSWSRRLIMLHFMSSIAAMRDSEMLKWAFSYTEKQKLVTIFLLQDIKDVAKFYLKFRNVSWGFNTFSKSAQLPKSCSER